MGVRGERSEIKPHLTGPIKRHAERQARSLGKSGEVEEKLRRSLESVWSLESAVGEELKIAEETGAGSAACHAVPCQTVGCWREAGEESPASGINGPRGSGLGTVRAMLRDGRALKESINSKRAKTRSFL